MNEKPELGQWLTINAIFRKSNNGYRTYWHRSATRFDKGRAMFIGTRQVYDGDIHTSHEGYIEGFTRTKSYNVWLFVFDGKRNPVYVLPEDVCHE